MSPTFLFAFSIIIFCCTLNISAKHGKGLDSEFIDYLSFNESALSDSEFPDSFFSGNVTSQNTENSMFIIPDSMFGGETSDSEFTSSMFSDLPTSIHSDKNNFENQPAASLPQNDGLKGSIEYFLDAVKNMPKGKLQNIATKFSKIINKDMAADEISNNILNEIPKTPSVENALEKVLENPKSMINSVEENFLEMLHAPGLQSEDIPKIKSGFKNAFKASDLSLSDISAIQRGVLKVLNVPGQKIPAVLQNVAKKLILPSAPQQFNPAMMLSPKPEFLNPVMMMEPEPEYLNPPMKLAVNEPPPNFMMNLLPFMQNFEPMRHLPQLGARPPVPQMRMPTFPNPPQMNIPFGLQNLNFGENKRLPNLNFGGNMELPNLNFGGNMGLPNLNFGGNMGLPNMNFEGNMIQLPEIARELFASIQSLEKGLKPPKKH